MNTTSHEINKEKSKGYSVGRSENESVSQKYVLGIDFGTTNSQACFIRDNREILIESRDGTTSSGKAYPSVVAYKKDEPVIVGKRALDLLTFKKLENCSVISKIKKLIKYSLVELKKKINSDPEFAKTHSVPVDATGKELEPVVVASEILRKIRQDASEEAGIEFKDAVITVPAYYSDLERENTKFAAELAGLNVVRLINEPTAAAIAYGFHDRKTDDRLIIFDLGGGTFDVTLVEISNGVIDVIGSRGVENTGGTNMTDLITMHLVKYWEYEHAKNKNIINLRDNPRVIDYLRNEVEQLKINLTYQFESEITIPELVKNQRDEWVVLQYTLNRTEMTKIIEPVLNNIKSCFKSLISEFNLGKEPIQVVLVGGPTRSVIIQNLITECLPNSAINKRIKPMTCVAVGAAIQGAILAGSEKQIALLDVAPVSIGVETLGLIFEKIVTKDTTLPCSKSKEFTNPEDNTERVDIRILRGERIKSTQNEELGILTLTGLPKMRASQSRIEVTLIVDANGQTTAKAVEKKSNVTAETVLKIKGRLTAEEIEKIMADAKLNEEADKTFKKNAELKNEVKALNYEFYNIDSEIKDKSAEDSVKFQAVRVKLDELDELIRLEDYAKLETSINEVRSLINELKNVKPTASQTTSSNTADKSGETPEEIVGEVV